MKVKENSIEEDILNIEKYIELVTEKNYCECNELNEIRFGKQCYGYGSRNVAYSMKRILSDYKRVIKENEKLKEERKNNNEMIAFAQNEMLNYMSGYEDGKNHKMTAVAQVVENQQYYIVREQMKRYEERIKRLQKENEELKETLKCTQNSWYEDTQKIEEMKKQIDLDYECEIALNNRIMDLENADKKWEDRIKAINERILELQELIEREK